MKLNTLAIRLDLTTPRTDLTNNRQMSGPLYASERDRVVVKRTMFGLAGLFTAVPVIVALVLGARPAWLLLGPMLSLFAGMLLVPLVAIVLLALLSRFCGITVD
jgi:hypothetical protein